MEKQVSKTRFFVILIVVAIALITSVVVLSNTNPKDAQKQLELGEKYLEELQYEEAISAFKAAIDIDPHNVDAYKGLAKAYVGLEDYDSAMDALYKGYRKTKENSLLVIEADYCLEYVAKLEASDNKAEAGAVLEKRYKETGDERLSSKKNSSVVSDLNITINDVTMPIPSYLSEWENAGFSVGQYTEGSSKYFIDVPGYQNFRFDATGKVLGGPYGDEICITSVEVPFNKILWRDTFATPDVPFVSVMDNQFILLDQYDLASMEKVYGDTWKIFSYGGVFEEHEVFPKVYQQWIEGSGKGWEIVGEGGPSSAIYTEYRYEKTGKQLSLSTLDTYDYIHDIPVNSLIGVKVEQSSFYDYIGEKTVETKPVYNNYMNNSNETHAIIDATMIDNDLAYLMDAEEQDVLNAFPEVQKEGDGENAYLWIEGEEVDYSEAGPFFYFDNNGYVKEINYYGNNYSIYGIYRGMDFQDALQSLEKDGWGVTEIGFTHGTGNYNVSFVNGNLTLLIDTDQGGESMSFETSDVNGNVDRMIIYR